MQLAMRPFGTRIRSKEHACSFSARKTVLWAPRRSASTAAGICSSRSTGTAAASKNDNPDLDEIVLDDDYYQEIGMTREQAMRQQQEILYSIDPEAAPLGLDTLGTINPDVLPDDLRRAVESLEVYGPQALILAGFRAEEYAVVRATLDSLGAHPVKVLAASDEMLYGSLDAALQEQEIDWSAPRPPEWIRGGTWGSQRTILFSGLSIKAQATLLELLEAQGLPPLCVTMATKDDAHRKLGDVMAEAVKAQRGYKPQPIAPWETNRGAPAPTTSSTTSSTSTTSSSSSKKASAPWVPGKKGRLFAKKGVSGSSASGAVVREGLESLQDLIPPDVARARLKFGPAITNSSPGAQQQQQQVPFPSPAQQQQQQQSGEGQAPGGPEDEPPATRLPDDSASDQDLLDWFNNEVGGPTVELPWIGDDSSGGGGAAAAAAAAAGMGFQQDSQQQQRQYDDSLSLDDVFAAAAAAGPISSSSSSSSSTESGFLSDLLPNTSHSAAAAAAARLNGAFEQQQRQGLMTDQGIELDDVNPAESASVLSMIQSALKSGVSAEDLKRIIDAAAVEGAAATDEVDLLLNHDAARAAAAAAAAQQQQQQGPAGPPRPQQQQQQQQQRQYGPSPPTKDEGLVGLRPEVEAAFENNQVKFVDLSRLPKKYKQRYSLDALKQQRQQQQDKAVQVEQQQQQQQEEGKGGKGQQRWWQQQSKRQQLARNLPAQVLSNLPSGGRVVKVDMGSPEAAAAAEAAGTVEAATAAAAASGAAAGTSSKVQPLYDISNISSSNSSSSETEPMYMQGGEEGFDKLWEGLEPAGAGQYDADFTDLSAAEAAAYTQQQQQWEGDEDEEEGEAEEPLVLDESKLRQLVDSAQEEGLDVSRALAEALAFGVDISPEAAAAVGLRLPGGDEIESAREGIAAAIRDMQERENPVSAAAAVAAGTGGERGEDVSSDGRKGGGGRAWGSGLTAAAQRAKARRQQQQQ